MYFDSISAALQMEGHGAFVWSAYLISFLVVVLMILAPRARQRKLLGHLKAQQRRLAGQPVADNPRTPE